MDPAQAACGCYRATIHINNSRSLEPARQLGEARHGLRQTHMRIARDQRDTGFIAAYGSDVHLASVGPVDLHKVGPGRDAIMAAKTEAERFAARRLQAGPLPDARVLSVSADDPACPHVRKVSHVSAPKEPDAEIVRAIDQMLMQPDAPHGNAMSARKIGRHASARADKSNPAKRERLLGINADAQLAERLERIRHQAFAASLVDGWRGGIGHHDIEAFETRGDRRNQASGAASDDEDVGLTHHGVRLTYHVSKTSSEQKPGPIAA